ncbi:hypothetical protein TNCT6_21250 [Streptomyces sp. 6-11-2]|nr:hypothetical protein TNCT6_21250 [Streptomyces sp. 6-11-2]
MEIAPERRNPTFRTRSWLNRDGISGQTDGIQREAKGLGHLGSHGVLPRIPPMGDPAANARLTPTAPAPHRPPGRADTAIRGLCGTAQPPPPRGTDRAALLTRIPLV